jgi:hypothetical protein
MIKTILKIFKSFIDWQTKLYSKLLPKVKVNLPYNSLTPTDRAEEVDDYLKTLEWALSKKDEIKNIAITGPYGSGKSSIIKTFQKKYKHNFKFLNISLATFKEENSAGTNEPTTKDDLLRLIELSILQQLFYHEKDSKIPDSRFKKIKNHKSNYLWITTIGLLIFIISFLHLVFPSFLAKFSLLELTTQNSQFFHTLSVVIVIAGVLMMMFKSIRTLKRVSIKKFGVNNASIEIHDRISKSILNNHLDEILYFFEVTKHNVVFIEDLDRFEQTDVFTKLREINLLINNSKKVEHDVVFIYAVRDDMFQDKDRTKFFDFMVPIIPVINFSNSSDKLLKIVNDNKYDISETLIDDISLFIDDMRLLYNIMNEYHLYSKKLNKTLKQDKLLSMIVYKNIYPNDFTLLSQNEGELYNILINKDKKQYILEKTSRIDKDILKIKDRIDVCEREVLRNVKELRMIYLYKIIEEILHYNSNISFHKFWINSQKVSLFEAVQDDNFSSIIGARTLQYYGYNNYYNNNYSTYNYNLNSIQRKMNPNLTYKERESLIRNNKLIEGLKNDIQKLKNQKDEIKKYKIKDFISDNLLKLDTKKRKSTELIIVLLRNGYIDEDYLDYISIFHEGSLSKNDHQFLIDVKTQKSNEFNYHLDRKENLAKRINVFDFEKDFILNYDLLDFLIQSSDYSEKRKKFFVQLALETDIVLKFIDGYIEHTANTAKFINYLSKEWSNIWQYISNQSKYPKEKTKKYFELIIKYADIDDIRKIFENSINDISDNSDFLLVISDIDKLKDVIKELDIQFNVLNKAAPKEILDYVYDNHHYSINSETVSFYIYRKGDSYVDILATPDNFERKNYSTIKQSGLENLISYIDNNIEKYISNVYLSLDKNTDEELQYYVELLNNPSISEENKRTIIFQVNTIINNISDIEDLELAKFLLDKSKVMATWDNLINIYIKNENEFIPEITSFINFKDNSSKLSKINIEKDVHDEEIIKSFVEALVLNKDIEDRTYFQILDSVPYQYKSLNFESLTYKKVEALIIKNKLVTNNANFQLLKKTYETLPTQLIDKDFDKFIADIDTFEIESDDLIRFLISKTVNLIKKEQILESFDKSMFIKNSELLSQIGKLLLTNRDMSIGNEIVLAIGTNSSLSVIDKIKIFNSRIGIYEENDISNFLISLGEPYSTIKNNEENTLLIKTSLNKELAQTLLSKKYISDYKVEKKGIKILIE